MPDYSVLFDPIEHTEEMYIPPHGVSGGIVGTTENGKLAVYDVPVECVEAFEASLDECPTVISRTDLDHGHTR